MNHLHQLIAARVDQWRNDGYPSTDYPAVGEVLDWSGETETGNLRFLRRPQLRALETYWYLRLVENTPHVFDLYRKYYPKQSELLTALGLEHTGIKARSEEHTSELQSPTNLVCRLLLEKKK